MQWSLKQKGEELEQMEATFQTLIIMECACNDELLEARKELIHVSISFCMKIDIYFSGGYFW